MDDYQFADVWTLVANGLDRARQLPEGDLLREIILGLVPSLCAIDLSTDPEIRRKTFWWLRDELNRYSAKCRERAVSLELCKYKPN